MFGWISGSAKRIAAPDCPQCERGALIEVNVADSDVVIDPKGATLRLWACTSCRHPIMAKDNANLRDIARDQFNKRVALDFEAAGDEELESMARKHTIASRLFYAGALLAALGCAYMILYAPKLIVALNWFAVSAALAIYGMKSSYRAWQVKSQTLFVEGSFWRWFRGHRWVI
jgi:hypothetical protein